MEKLKIKGGIATNWEGKPAARIADIFTPTHLRLPLASRRILFDKILVQDGDQVEAGHVLARAEKQFDIPLLAPLGGTVTTEKDEDGKVTAIRVDELNQRERERDLSPEPPAHAETGTQHIELRKRFLEGGGWPLLHTFPEMGPPDPEAQLDGVVISWARYEPFRPHGHVLIDDQRLAEFALGLEALQSMFTGYQKINLIVSHERDRTFSESLLERCRGYAWLDIKSVNKVYPYGHPGAILLNMAEAKVRKSHPYWAMCPEAVLAMHRILVTNRPVLSRVISLGGPGIAEPTHIRVYPGTPVRELLEGRMAEGAPDKYRFFRGGVFTGEELDPEVDSLNLEDDAITVIRKGDYQQFLGFMRPGFHDHSMTRTFVADYFPLLEKRLSTRKNGELRACIQCNKCEDVCPVPYLMPYLYHRFLPLELIDEMEAAGIWNCIECGCCSYACPSKIPLLEEIKKGKRLIIEEMEEMEED
ncbi:MAG: 4Fe-4S dicluster domain-containing protein [Candidatus Sumerlaeia bacterium]